MPSIKEALLVASQTWPHVPMWARERIRQWKRRIQTPQERAEDERMRNEIASLERELGLSTEKPDMSANSQ